MKVGRSEQARAATVSHTASLAGSDAASDAFLKRLGIPRVDTIPSFLETLKLLHAIGPLAGAHAVLDELLGRRGLGDGRQRRGPAACRFPALDRSASRRACRRRSGRWSRSPTRSTTTPIIWDNEPAMTATFSAMVSGGFDLNMLVLDFPRTDRCSDADWWPTVNAFEAALKANGAKGAIVASMGENLPEGHAEELLAARHRAVARHRRGDGCGRGGGVRGRGVGGGHAAAPVRGSSGTPPSWRRRLGT